jgi:hypothetical protein
MKNENTENKKKHNKKVTFSQQRANSKTRLEREGRDHKKTNSQF